MQLALSRGVVEKPPHVCQVPARTPCPFRAHGSAVGYGVPVSTPARDDDLIAAAHAADLRQAEYFRSELLNQCEQLDDRMMTHRIALAKYESRDAGPSLLRPIGGHAWQSASSVEWFIPYSRLIEILGRELSSVSFLCGTAAAWLAGVGCRQPRRGQGRATGLFVRVYVTLLVRVD
jgi:hypothetical protein